MNSKSLWQKMKDVVLYIVFTIIFVSLTGSFVVQDVYAAANKISMKPEGVEQVYTINIGARSNSNNQAENENNTEITTEDGRTINVTEYAVGDTSDEILEYEQILYDLGFMKSKPGTAFTEEVQTALKTYQAMRGLEATGKLDRSTIISLVAENIKFVKGDSSQLLQTYQKILVKQKYLAETDANGTFGDTTEAAVKAFQKANGLTETGKIDANTIKALDALR
ncbi:peptidoglycan-binding domain-containing protein [Acetobacterium sp.]|uniref:peptidoglycan-binding domain-containing protein n=1 Tax=Acetobacterium sp. TaxID=1872094 RepID=UPI002F415CC7